MNQKSLMPDSDFVGVENAAPGSMITTEAPEVDSSAIRDLRSGFMMMKVPEQKAAMAEFKARRDSFREWLVSQMQEGLHFGYSPGTQPKWCDANGRACDEKDAWGTMGKQNIPLTSWRPKKALYAAGADFVCDLLGIRDELETDHNGWLQAGSNAGTFVVNCKLISRSSGELLANGLGLAMTSGEQLGQNAALKKAGKRAKVAAVLDYLGLRDLFTGDRNEDADKHKSENPDQSPTAPKVPPRAERYTRSDLETLYRDWQAEMHRQEHTKEFFNKENFAEYCQRHAQARFDVTKADNWTEGYMVRVRAALQGGLA